MSLFPGFTNEEVEDIKQQALAFWDKSTTEYDTFFKNVDDRERMAHALLPADLQTEFDAHIDRSAIAPPDFFININSLTATTGSLVYDTKPFGQVSRFGEPTARDEQVLKAEAVLQFINDLSNDDAESRKIVHQAMYAGLSCGITRWTRLTKPSILRDPDTNFPVGHSNDTLIEYPETVAQDIRRVRIDPFCDKLSERRIVGRHYLMNLFDLFLMNRNPSHWYKFNEGELDRSSFDRAKYYEYLGKEKDALNMTKTSDGTFGDKTVEVKEIRGLFRLGKDENYKMVDLCVDIGNNAIVLGIKYNDLPIHSWELYDFATVDSELGRTIPMGVIEAATDEWIYLFLVKNHIIDRNNREIYQMFFADRNAMSQGGQVQDYIQFENGKIIWTDIAAAGMRSVGDAIQPVILPPRQDSSYQLAGITSQVIQRMMKLSDYVQGLDPSRTETATGVTELVSGGKQLLVHMVKHLRDSYWKPEWQKKLILWNNFNGHKQYSVNSWDGKQYNVAPAELDWYYEINIDVSANIERQVMTRRLIEAMPMLINNPNINQNELIKTVYAQMKLPNKDRVVIDNGMVDLAIEKENAAMMENVPQPVHPAEPHEAHLKGHTVVETAKGTIPHPVLKTPSGAQHVQEHQQYIQQQSMGLSNTKETGNTGQIASGNLPAATRGLGAGAGFNPTGGQ
jgi:hypothetical protein